MILFYIFTSTAIVSGPYHFSHGFVQQSQLSAFPLILASAGKVTKNANTITPFPCLKSSNDYSLSSPKLQTHFLPGPLTPFPARTLTCTHFPKYVTFIPKCFSTCLLGNSACLLFFLTVSSGPSRCQLSLTVTSCFALFPRVLFLTLEIVNSQKSGPMTCICMSPASSTVPGT